MALFVLLALPPRAEAKVTYEHVEMEGRGKTRTSAITDALIQAVEKVNGRSVQAASVVLELEGALTREGKEEDISADLLLSVVVNRTRGGIKTFKVLSKSKEESTWIVRIVATVARYEAGIESKRMSIAVFPLRVSSHPFEILGKPIDKNRFERLMNQALVSYLVQTRKFTVLDRNYIIETVGENSIIASGSTPPEEIAKLGQQLSADLMLVGTIEGAQVKEVERHIRSGDRILKWLTGSVEFSYRLINVPTRQVLLSDLYTAQYGEKDLNDPGETDLQLIKLASQDLGRLILYSIYPVRIESVVGDEVTIGQGGNSIHEGDEFDIYELGEEIVDTYTKESLGKHEERIGRVKIVRVTSQMSTGRIMESDIDLVESFATKRFIIRPTQDTKINATKTVEDLRMDIRDRREERDRRHEDDW